MGAILPIVTWYSFLGGILYVFQRYTRCLTELNVFTLFVGFFVLRHGLTVPFDDDVNEWFAGISVSARAIARYHAALYIMWASIVAGVVAGRSMLGSIRHAVHPSRRIKGGVNALFLPAVVVALALLFAYQLRLDANFWKMLSGQLSAGEYREMRDSLGQSTSYSINAFFRISSIIRFGLLPFFIYTLYFLSERGWVWRLFFWLSLGTGLLLGVSSGQKSPAIFLCIGFIIARCFRSDRPKLKLLNLKLWLALALAVFVVIPTLYRLQYSEQSYTWRLRATFFRLSSEYDRSLQLYFEIYPQVEGFLHGKSSSLLDSALGIDMPQGMLPERFIPSYYVGPDYQDTWNAAFVGVAWADFGYYGVGVESMLVGLILYTYCFWFARAPRTAVSLGLQVAVLMAATKLSEVALTASLLSFGLLTSGIAYIALHRNSFGPSRPAPHKETFSLNSLGVRQAGAGRGPHRSD